MNELTQKQIQAVKLIANGMRLGDVAKTLKINDRTLLNWRNLPEFARQLRELKADSYNAALNRLQGACDDAANTLIELCTSTQSPPQIRLKAAELILNFSKPTEVDEDMIKSLGILAKAGVLPTQTAEKVGVILEDFLGSIKETLKKDFNNIS